ncbi:MAG TPA: VOC family protein [Acidimicrobiia bacterium]|nr:VOC family protein [Acidimicrobiia bacterium]
MARVTGVGGVFFRAANPAALMRWYVEVLGLPVDDEGYNVFRYQGEETVTWAPFPEDTTYFGSAGQQAMVNYRVDDLDGILERLRSSGAEIDERTEDHPYGRFGWATDPEGNRLELWQPRPGH